MYISPRGAAIGFLAVLILAVVTVRQERSRLRIGWAVGIKRNGLRAHT